MTSSKSMIKYEWLPQPTIETPLTKREAELRKWFPPNGEYWPECSMEKKINAIGLLGKGLLNIATGKDRYSFPEKREGCLVCKGLSETILGDSCTIRHKTNCPFGYYSAAPGGEVKK